MNSEPQQKLIKKEKEIEINNYLYQEYFIFNYIEAQHDLLHRQSTVSKKKIQVPENNINIIWEELSSLLAKDDDFKIEKIDKNSIIIKALSTKSFNNNYIMAKIIGRIIPFNCKLKLSLRNFRAENPKDDKFIYDFSIDTDNSLFYKGIIYIKR